MKLIKLSGIALSVALASQASSVVADTNNEDGFNALNYGDASYVEELSQLSPEFSLTAGEEGDSSETGDKDNIKLLDVTYEFLNEHIASGNTTLSFTVDGVSFEFTTRVEYHYGLLHLYGENSQGNFMRFIRGDKDSWFGDVSNGDKSYSLIDTVEIHGPGWFISSIRIPNKGDILVNGQLPVAATKDNATVIDMGYTYNHMLEGRYGHLGMRASMLYFHYQLQDVLDNSGSGYFLNPVYMERQDKRFFTDEEINDLPKGYIGRGWEYMFGEQTGAEAIRDYLGDFGADFHVSFVRGVVGCGARRNEYKLDDIGQPAYVYSDEEDRAEILYGSLLDGTRHSCRNLNLIPHFLIHGFARPNREYYENNPFLPANKRTDFGGSSDYAYAQDCGGVPTIFNLNLTVENLPLPVVTSPSITYKGQMCGDEKNDNLRALQDNLPSVVDNGQMPAASADVSFKSVVFVGDETIGKATVTLVREGELSTSASVELSALAADNNMAAVAGIDFKQGFARVEFAQGESEASVDVPIIDNDIYRESGIIELALNMPKRLNIKPNTQAQLLIIDNDSAKPGSFNFASNQVTISEDSETALIKVIRSGDFEGSQMIRYSFVDGTARNGSDYNAEDGYIVFTGGETEHFIKVELVADSYQNATERSFTVQIDTDVEGDIQTTEVIIGDDEAATGFVSLATETLDVDYHASQASITLIRQDGDLGEITVYFETVDGTALAGTHYAAGKGSIKFASGETEKTINIKKLNVTAATEQTTFTVALASPQLSGAKIVSVNLLPQVEREEDDSSGGSLGIFGLLALAFTGYRRKYR